MIQRLKRLFRRGNPVCCDVCQVKSISFYSGLGDSAWVIYSLVKSLKPEVCVEIGSARGLSACHAGLALKENGRGVLYAIDPHCQTLWNDSESVDTFEIFKQNIARLNLGAQVQILRDYSTKVAPAWKQPIDVLFIDGDHSYAGVKQDWDLFIPHVKSSGVVIFHDTMWNIRPDPRYARADMGVPRFVDELRQAGYPVITLLADCGVSLVQTTRHGIPLQ